MVLDPHLRATGDAPLSRKDLVDPRKVLNHVKRSKPIAPSVQRIHFDNDFQATHGQHNKNF